MVRKVKVLKFIHSIAECGKCKAETKRLNLNKFCKRDYGNLNINSFYFSHINKFGMFKNTLFSNNGKNNRSQYAKRNKQSHERTASHKIHNKRPDNIQEITRRDPRQRISTDPYYTSNTNERFGMSMSKVKNE